VVDFLGDSVRELADRVRAGDLSARELVRHALARIEALDPLVRAFVAVDEVGALAEAAEIDASVARGEDPGPLAGIPLAVKDLHDAVGLPTTFGSLAGVGTPPATRDHELVARLRAAGCVVVGKTNTPSFGHKSDTVNLVFPATRNPWDVRRSPGGSSGGSAAALAAGMVPLATGTDGGGSIRIPSACCGFTGMKPSLGRVPTGGPRPPEWHHVSTDGPMARRATDLAFVLDTVIGPDASDLRSLPMPEASWAGAVADPHVPLRVVWSPRLGYGHPTAEVLAVCERALGTLAGMGAEIVRIDEVFSEDPLPTWATMVSAYLARAVTDHGAEEDAEESSLAVYVELGRALTALQLVAAEDACHQLNRRLVEVLAGHSVLLTPTTASTAPLSGELGVLDGEPTPNWIEFTYPFNLTRSPAGTVCAGITPAGLPVGLQVVGPQHGDQVVLRTLAALEAAFGLPSPPPLD
jgi:aspartyl-tRNA(Asn)/glutamyl-tRNA(Gln) amidotransferase subunit A